MIRITLEPFYKEGKFEKLVRSVKFFGIVVYRKTILPIRGAEDDEYELYYK